MGRFKTLLMLTNAMYDVPPLPLAAIHRFHPIESVLGEVDVVDPPRHLAHLGQTDSTIFNLAKKLWKKVAISIPWRNIHFFFLSQNSSIDSELIIQILSWPIYYSYNIFLYTGVVK